MGLVIFVGLVGLVSLLGLVGLGYFRAILSDPEVFSNGIVVFDDPNEFNDPQVSVDPKGNLNGRIDFDISLH